MVERSCGTCSACCVLPSLDIDTGIPKVAGGACSKLSGAGCEQCTIYEHRPTACADFYCEWLKGIEGTGDGDRPDHLPLLLQKRTFTEGPIREMIMAYEVTDGASDFPEVIEVIKKIAKHSIVLVLTPLGMPHRLYPSTQKEQVDQCILNGELRFSGMEF
jgi:hypothetical protein